AAGRPDARTGRGELVVEPRRVRARVAVGEVSVQGTVPVRGGARRGPTAQRVATVGFDAHDRGAAVREQARAVGAGDPGRQVDDAGARERPDLHAALPAHSGCSRPDLLSRHSGGKLRSLPFTALLRPRSIVSRSRPTTSRSASGLSGPRIDSSQALSRLPMCSPWCCFMISKNTFWANTVSVGRLFAHAMAYLAVSSSSRSRGTTLLTKARSAISWAVKGRPVNTISWNFRRPIVVAHCHMRGA